MRKIFDKYWGLFDKLNDNMFFFRLLDPQMKSDKVESTTVDLKTINIHRQTTIDLKATNIHRQW